MGLSHQNDTSHEWGWLDKSEVPFGKEPVLRRIPKVPMLLAGMGPPPFDVKLEFSGEVRRIIEIEEDGHGEWKPYIPRQDSESEIQRPETGQLDVASTV